MKKLVIKTTLITLASIIVAVSIAFGALCLFAPVTVAGFFDGVGNYSASVFFYEKQYEKSGDVKDLDSLFVKSYGVKDYARSEKYLLKLIDHADFDKLLSEGENALWDKEYYYGCLVLSLANNGKLNTAVDYGASFVTDNGYTEHNPLRTLALEFVNESTSTKDKQIIKDAISSCTNVSSLQEAFRQSDLLKLK